MNSLSQSKKFTGNLNNHNNNKSSTSKQSALRVYSFKQKVKQKMKDSTQPTGITCSHSFFLNIYMRVYISTNRSRECLRWWNRIWSLMHVQYVNIYAEAYVVTCWFLFGRIFLFNLDSSKKVTCLPNQFHRLFFSCKDWVNENAQFF